MLESKPMKHEQEKSDLFIIALKPTNKPGRLGAELVEPRERTEGMDVPTAMARNYEGNWSYIRTDWTDAGQVLDLIKAVPEAAPQKLRRCVTSGSRLNVQFLQMEE